MPFTFPHFGSLKYVFEVVLRELGRTDILVPKKPNKKTFQLGARYSPEFVCTPFKITLGTFIEMLEEGATELGMGGCNAYCRFGYYWPVQKLILEDLGYDFEFIPLNYEKPWELIKVMKNRVSNGCNLLQTIRAFRIAWVKCRFTDLTDKLLYKYRAIEIEEGTSERVANKAYRKIVKTKGMRNIRKLRKEIPAMFEKEVEIDTKANPLKVGIVGEIYVVLEPSLNVEVHHKMNKLGVIVETPVTLRRFIDVGQKLNPFVTMHYKKAAKTAKPYLAHRLGGEAQENLGDAILYKKKGWDGMIHLYPFTCMPEIITRSILPQISREYNFPVLSLVVDEHTGDAGFQTRLEAYVDLLARKREANGE
ncbi:MAG: CoA protein activase [Candidatus Heimdallarchaeota archaeon]|nr:CoA protein activase [Candidatus Heimdallarchaeota archaeon]